MKRRTANEEHRRDGEKIRRLEVECARLRAEVSELKSLVATLIEEVKTLRGKLAKSGKDSSTSSKPPSSDIVKPKKAKPKGGGKRRAGGQPGHQKHERQFSLADADHQHGYMLDACPKCHAVDLLLLPEATKYDYQYELVAKPLELHAHVRFGAWCPHCNEIHYDELPPEVRRGGLVGPRLSALIAYLKGGCHASYSTIQSFVNDALGARLSTGMIAKVIKKATAALDQAYTELLGRLPQEGQLNIDETGHKELGKKFWTWCFCAKLYTLFLISKSRGSEVLFEVLGKEFDGIVGCDYFAAYRKFMKDSSILVQFCLAHLIRDLRFLTTLPDKATQNYGKRVLKEFRVLFRVIHQRETLDPALFQAKLEKARERILKVIRCAPLRSEAQNIAKRFREHGKAYFLFITTPGIEPTNNIAERAIRAVVIDRKITQGTRGMEGRRWCERIWTTMATCAQQGRSAFEFIHESIASSFQGHRTPSLLSGTS